ncbi:MAG: SNF2-related protein [Nitrospira sp.]
MTTTDVNIADLFQTSVEPLELWDYQIPWVEKMVAQRRQLLGAEMGLGKTPPAIQALIEINPDSAFIVGTRRTIFGWIRMMKRWYPDYLKKFTIIMRDNTGGETARAEQWAKRPAFVITTFQIAARDTKHIKRINYNFVAADELHKFMRSRNTIAHKLLKRLGCIYMILITGSPVAGKHAGEWWIYLNLLNPQKFPSYWKFINKYCIVIDGPFGKETYGYNPNYQDELRGILRQYCILTQKKELGKARKVRSFLDVEMEPAQRQIYRDLVNDLLHFDPDHGVMLVAKNELSVHTKLRQLLVCPALLDPRLGMGSGLKNVLEELEELTRDNRHCVIYTPFAQPIPLIIDFVKQSGLVGNNVFGFRGGQSFKQLHESLEEWKRTKGIAIMSIQYAESFDMETSDLGFFLGYDWDPIANKQAEDRIDRAINLFKILNYRYVRHEGTVDDHVMMRIVEKQINLTNIYNDPERIRELYGHLKKYWEDPREDTDTTDRLSSDRAI